MLYKRWLRYAVWLLLLWRTATAQPPVQPHDGTGNYQRLYTGAEYIGSYPGTTGHPYYTWDTLQPGTISYDGVYYRGIGLKYDLVSNELVLMGRQALLISLARQKVDSFSIGGHRFSHLRQDTGMGLNETSFYEWLQEGPVCLLARREKKVERGSRVEDPFVFKPYNFYYLKKEGRFYAINRETDLLAVLNDERDALKKQARQLKLNFKKAREESFIEMVRYYNQKKN